MKQKPHDTSISNLIIQISKLRRNKSNALLSDAEIHSGQDALLYYLSLEDGQTVSELVEKLSIQRGMIAGIIERMETTGVIRKEKHETDKRTSRIYLTKKGQDALIKIAVVWRTMEATTTKGFSKADENILRELLQRVFKNLS